MKKILLIILCFCSIAKGLAPDQKPNIGSQINRGDSASVNIIGLWLMNEGTGNRVHDLSGNDNHGTFAGTAPAWTIGNHGYAISLPGTNEYVDCGSSSLIDAATELTCLVWVKCGSDGAADHTVIATYGTATRGFALQRDNAGSISGRTDCWTVYGRENAAVNGFQYESAQDSAVIAEGWQCVVFQLKCANATFPKMWINGVRCTEAIGDTMADTDDLNSGGQGFRIGARTDNDRYFDGDISLAILWDCLLPDEEIKHLSYDPFCYMYEPFLGTSSGTPIPVFYYHYVNH